MSNQNEGIYFGSIENSQRQRIEEQLQNSETSSIASKSTQVSQKPQTSTFPIIQSNSSQFLSSASNRSSIANPNVEILQLSQESLQAKKRHQENQRKLQVQTMIRQLNIPINDKDVQMILRNLFYQPICYFGENSAQRRERLRLLTIQYIQTRHETPNFSLYTKRENDKDRDKDLENQHFFYRGDQNLKNIRMQILKESFKKAAMRIERSKLKKLTTDALEEEDQMDAEVKQIQQFEVSLCQFADTSVVSRGDFCPLGNYYGTAGSSGECHIWTVPDCERKTKLLGHIGKAHDILFHPECGQGMSANCFGNIATCSSDMTVRLWTMDQEAELQKSIVLKGHDDRVNRLSFHNTGKYLISTSHDATWKFWDIEKQKEIYTQTGHTRAVYANCIHPDGSILFTGDLAGTGMIWDLRTGKSILPLIGHVKGILCSDFHSNGYHLVTGGDDNTMRIWDLRRKNTLHLIPGHLKLVSDVQFQADYGRFLMSVSYDNTMKIWNPKDWALAKVFQAHESQITSIQISPENQYIATTSMDRQFMLWQKPV